MNTATPIIRCPTCTDSKPGRCCSCGLKDDDMKLNTNPYAAKFKNDYRLHLECSNCQVYGRLILEGIQ